MHSKGKKESTSGLVLCPWNNVNETGSRIKTTREKKKAQVQALKERLPQAASAWALEDVVGERPPQAWLNLADRMGGGVTGRHKADINRGAAQRNYKVIN